MLEIINNLKPFFEDCYRRISVREYSKIINISPPTASKILNKYHKSGLLNLEEDRNYLFFHSNQKSKTFINLSRMYWTSQLQDLIRFLNKNLLSPTIVLFGSLSKGEAKKDSDIDLAIFSNEKKINLSKFEKKLKRKIQIHWFKSLGEIKKELANNIINGYLIGGKLRL